MPRRERSAGRAALGNGEGAEHSDAEPTTRVVTQAPGLNRDRSESQGGARRRASGNRTLRLPRTRQRGDQRGGQSERRTKPRGIGVVSEHPMGNPIDEPGRKSEEECAR